MLIKYICLERILFSGKQNIQWHAVEAYLKRFVGMRFTVKEYGDMLRVNSSFTDEYTESQYTKKLRGSLAKVKANIV